MKPSKITHQAMRLNRSAFKPKRPPFQRRIDFDPVEMTTRELFRRLVSYTCPHGFEDMLYGDTLLRLGWVRDKYGNYHFRTINELDSLFAAHMDTADSGTPSRVMLNETKPRLIGSQRNTILGADDKSGMTILLKMAHEFKTPGYYILFTGEERGCIGSSGLAHDPSYWKFLSTFNRMISFDRRGYDSVITFQFGERCCSDAFALALAEQINDLSIYLDAGIRYKPDPTGIFTDSAMFTEIIPECTNVSVGYHREHTNNEVQNIAFLEAITEIFAYLDWDELPVERDPYSLRVSTI